jgi:hypothetical protein
MSEEIKTSIYRTDTKVEIYKTLPLFNIDDDLGRIIYVKYVNCYFFGITIGWVKLGYGFSGNRGGIGDYGLIGNTGSTGNYGKIGGAGNTGGADTFQYQNFKHASERLYVETLIEPNTTSIESFDWVLNHNLGTSYVFIKIFDITGKEINIKNQIEKDNNSVTIRNFKGHVRGSIATIRVLNNIKPDYIWIIFEENYSNYWSVITDYNLFDIDNLEIKFYTIDAREIIPIYFNIDEHNIEAKFNFSEQGYILIGVRPPITNFLKEYPIFQKRCKHEQLIYVTDNEWTTFHMLNEDNLDNLDISVDLFIYDPVTMTPTVINTDPYIIDNPIRESENWNIIVRGVPEYVASDELCPDPIPSIEQTECSNDRIKFFIRRTDETGLCVDTELFSTLNFLFDNDEIYDGFKATSTYLIIALNRLTPGKVKNITITDQTFHCESGYEPTGINIEYQKDDESFKINWLGVSNITNSLQHYDKYIEINFHIEFDLSYLTKLQVTGMNDGESQSKDYDFYLDDVSSETFFNYNNSSSHTNFEESQVVVVYFYQNVKTNKDTLHVLCDKFDSGIAGSIDFKIKGLPINYKILIKNDLSDYYQEENGDLIVKLTWTINQNDGLVIENITPFNRIEIISSNYINLLKWKVLTNVTSFEYDIESPIIFNYERITEYDMPLYNVPLYTGCVTPSAIPNINSNCGYISTSRAKCDLFTDYGYTPEIINKNQLKITFFRCFKNLYTTFWTPSIGGRIKVKLLSEECETCPPRVPYRDGNGDYQKMNVEKTFDTPSSKWFIRHNLFSKNLGIILYDLDDNILVNDSRIDIVYDTYNALTIYFFKYEYEDINSDEVHDLLIKPLSNVIYVKRVGKIKIYRKNNWQTFVTLDDIQNELVAENTYQHPISGGTGGICETQDSGTWQVDFKSDNVYLSCYDEQSNIIIPSMVFPNSSNERSAIFTNTSEESFTEENLLQLYSGSADIFNYNTVINSSIRFESFLPNNFLDEYVFVSKIPSQEWIITHNFNTYNIEIINIQDFSSNDYQNVEQQYDNGGFPVQSNNTSGKFNLVYINENSIKLIFNKPQSGKVLIKKYEKLDYIDERWTGTEHLNMFIYRQEKKEYKWTIIHPLNNIDIGIDVVDWNGNELQCDIEIVDKNTIIIDFYKFGEGPLTETKLPVKKNGKALLRYIDIGYSEKFVKSRFYIRRDKIQSTYNGEKDTWYVNHSLDSDQSSIRCYDFDAKQIIPSEIVIYEDHFLVIFDSNVTVGGCLVREFLDSSNVLFNGEYIYNYNSSRILGSRYIPRVEQDCYWKIKHDLGVKFPRVICVDSDGYVIIPHFIHYISESYLEIVFANDANNKINYNSGTAYVYRFKSVKSIFNFEISETGATGGTGSTGGVGYGSIGGTGDIGKQGTSYGETLPIGGRGGTGAAGGPGDFEISIPDVNSKISISHLRVEVGYPNNYNRVVHFENIYNAPQTLPHTFHNLGEVFTWDKTLINRRPFEYHWSEDGSQIRVKFIDLKIGFVFPSIKYFDTAYYKFWSSSNSWKLGDDPSEFFGTGGPGGITYSGETTTGGTGVGFTNFLTYDDYVEQNLDNKLNVNLETSSEEWVEGVYFDEFNEGHIQGIEHYFANPGYYVWTSNTVPNNRRGWAWSPGKYQIRNFDFDIHWSPKGLYGRRFYSTPHHRLVVGTVEKGALYYYFEGQKPWKYWPSVSGQKIYESARTVWSDKPIIIWSNHPIMEWSEGIIGANFPIEATYDDVAQFLRATHGIGYWFLVGGSPSRESCSMPYGEIGDQCYHGWGPGWLRADAAHSRYHKIPTEERRNWFIWTGNIGATGSPGGPNFERGWLWSPDWGCYVWADKPSSTGEYFYGEGFWTWTGGTGEPGEGTYEYINTTDIGDNQDHRIVVFNDTRNDKNQPPEISGDMSRHGLIYDGDRWYDYGIVIGTHAGFVPDQWEGITTLSSFNINTHIENENTIVFTFTHPRTGEAVNMWKQILNSPERFEVVCVYNYFEI